MLNDQLAVVEQLVEDCLRRQPENYEELQSLILNDLQSEVTRIRRNFKQAVYNTDSLERLQRYLRDHHHQLILMMDPLAARLRPEQRSNVRQVGTSFQWFDSYRLVYLCLEELVVFTERNFGSYLDISYAIPVSSLIEEPDSLNECMTTFRKGLSDAGISPEYQDVIIRPLYDLLALSAEETTIPYQQLLFLHKLKEGLSDLLVDNDQDITDRLLELFVYIDFNCIDCYKQIIRQFQDEMAATPITADKLNRLNSLQVRINQIPENPGFSHGTNRWSLKQKLLTWLKEEIGFIGDYIGSSDKVDVPSDLLQWRKFKLRLNLSVYELGYLVALLFEKAVIGNKQKSVVLRFIVAFFSTINQDELTEQSLRTKMYNPTPSTIKSVNSMLVDLANDARDRKRFSSN